MALNVDAVNPCIEFENNIQKGLGVLDGKRLSMGPVKDAMADITDAGTRIDENLVGRVSDNMTAGLNETLSSMDTLTESTEGLVGSCLNAVTGPLNTYAESAAGMTTDLMGAASNVADVSELVGSFGTMTDSFFTSAFSPVTGILNKVTGMDSLVNTLGVSNVISGLDELLGCAADSTCGELISAETIDGYFTEIQDFLDEFALDENGEIDLANVMDLAGIGTDIASEIDINMNILQDSTDAIALKSRALITSTVGKLIDTVQY